jgi:hypothetical protein
VNRLIQIFLQFNMMKQVEILLKILLDFECEYFFLCLLHTFLFDLQKTRAELNNWVVHESLSHGECSFEI